MVLLVPVLLIGAAIGAVATKVAGQPKVTKVALPEKHNPQNSRVPDYLSVTPLEEDPRNLIFDGVLTLASKERFENTESLHLLHRDYLDYIQSQVKKHYPLGGNEILTMGCMKCKTPEECLDYLLSQKVCLHYDTFYELDDFERPLNRTCAQQSDDLSEFKDCVNEYPSDEADYLRVVSFGQTLRKVKHEQQKTEQEANEAGLILQPVPSPPSDAFPPMTPTSYHKEPWHEYRLGWNCELYDRKPVSQTGETPKFKVNIDKTANTEDLNWAVQFVLDGTDLPDHISHNVVADFYEPNPHGIQAILERYDVEVNWV